MSVDYRAFAEFAEGLLGTDTEISWRMSAARAYYASYHRSKKSADHCPDNAHLHMPSHERLTERFLAYGTPGAKSIAYVLQTMKKVRHIADYELDDPFERCGAVNQLAQHKVLVQKLDSFDAMILAKSA
jgi:hypothetical protein